MKDKVKHFICCIVGIILGLYIWDCIEKSIYYNTENTSPKIIMSYGEYNVINVYNTDLFTIELQDKLGNIYQSDYISEDLEDLVCNKGIYEYMETSRHYDCSTPQKIKEAMIKELTIQTIQLIEEE